MSDRSLGVFLNNLVVRLRPDYHANPRHAFQVRFFLSACVLALVVAALSIPIAVFTEPAHTSITIFLFAVLIVLQLGLSRFGFPIRILVWSLLGTVTVFLIAVSAKPGELEPEQLPWLILIPLAARAFTAPRIEDSDPQPTFRVTMIGGMVAFAALLIIVALHQLGLSLGEVPVRKPLWATVANFGLFLISALGLVILYDYAAQTTIVELQRVRQLLAICAWCREINSDGEWMTLEDYTKHHTNSELSHGICPKCADAEFKRLKARFG
jgi:hypothetical protein